MRLGFARCSLLGICSLMICLATQSARADILFLDLNDSPREIEAAQKAAAARGEKLIVRPVMAADFRKQMTTAADNLKRWRREFDKHCLGAGADKTSQCQTIIKEHEKAWQAQSKLAAQRPILNIANLQNELEKLKKEKANISSLIISGHDGNGHFNGVQGDLSDKELDQAFKANAPLGDSVRSVLLWGCYTTTLGALEFHWKGIFPNANMIAGYDGRAPLADKPANWAYLEDVLKKEKQLTSARDKNEMQKIFKSISGANMVASSICVNQDDIITYKKVGSIKEEMARCKPPGSDDLANKYKCYRNAEPGCEDVPKDTGSGPVREYYNYLQDTRHCADVLASSGYFPPSPDEVLRILFDRQVRENFGKVYSKEISALDEALGKLGLPEDARLGDISKGTRREYIDRFKKVQSALNEREKAFGDQKSEDEGFYFANSMFEGLYMTQSNPTCAPFAWVEPNARVGSSCFGYPDGEGIRMAREGAVRRVAGVKLDKVVNETLATHSKAAEIKSLTERLRVIDIRTVEEYSDVAHFDRRSNVSLPRDQRAPSARAVIRTLEREARQLYNRRYMLEEERNKEMASQVVQRLETELKAARAKNAGESVIAEITIRIKEWNWLARELTKVPSGQETEGPEAIRFYNSRPGIDDDAVSQPPTPVPDQPARGR